MEDSPRGAFPTEDDGTASEPLGVVELERDQDDIRRQRLNAKADGRKTVKRWAARSVSAHIGKDGAKRGVDRGAASHTLGQSRRRMEDRSGVGEGGAKRLPLQIFECGEETTQHTGDGGRVAPDGTDRLGA